MKNYKHYLIAGMVAAISLLAMAYPVAAQVFPTLQFTLTTTGSSGAATFSNNVLNIPQYSGGGGSSGLGTTSPWTAGQVAEVINGNTVGGISTSSATVSSPLTGSFTVIGSGSIGCQIASASQAGCLSSSDWSTFNGKDSFAYPFPSNATSSVIDFSSGIITNASTTLSQLGTGAVSASNGLLSAGTLSTANGGTATSTNGIQGQVEMIGAGGNLITATSSLTIATSRNVGVGTTSPYSLLSIGGNLVVGASTAGGTLGSEYLPALATAAGTFLAADPTGKIIATSSPSGSNSAFSPAANYATTGTLPSYTYSLGVITAVSNGALSVDGANPSVGQIVLVKNESGACTSSSGACNNGLYNVTAAGSAIAAFVLTRNSNYNSSSNVIPGIVTYVISGTANNDDFWAMTSAAPITIGSTALNYTEVSGGSSSVTSVQASGGTTGLTFSGGPITSSGTLTLGGTLGIANGGTGVTSLSGNQILYTNNAGSAVLTTASSTLFGVGTPGYVWSYQNGAAGWYATSSAASAGVSSIQQTYGSAQTGVITLATTTDSYQGLTFGETITNTSGTFTFSNAVSGTLTVAGGGTGITSVADGALLYGGAGGGAANLVALATSTAGDFLQLSATTGRPLWSATLGIGNGGTGATSFSDNVLIGTTAAGTALAATGTPELTIGFINATSTSGQSTFMQSIMIGNAFNSGALLGTSTLLQMSTSTNNFAQEVLANTNTGTDASVDYTTGNSLTTNVAYYGDFGQNGSAFSNPAFTGESANDVYLQSSDSNLDLEAASSTGAFGIRFLTGGTLLADVRATITNTGLFGIGSTTPWAQLSVNDIAGTAPFAVGSSTADILWITSLEKIFALDVDNAWNGMITPTRYLSLGTATTTSQSGTSTAAYDPAVTLPFAGTLENVICNATTTSAFLGIQPYIGTTALSYLIASNTPGVFKFTASNTFTQGQLLSFAYGTNTASTANVGVYCTFAAVQTS